MANDNPSGAIMKYIEVCQRGKKSPLLTKLQRKEIQKALNGRPIEKAKKEMKR